MQTHGDLAGWVSVEVLLSLPAVVGLVGLTLAGPFRELRVMPRETFLQAVLYPYVGAAVAAVLGVGVGEIYAGKPDGVLILGVGALSPMYLGGYIGKLLRKDEREDTDRFRPNCWLPDIERLRAADQLDRHERLAYLKRADELGAAGRAKCLEVEESQFSTFWHSRKRRVRIIGYAWCMGGALFAVSGVRTVGSVWCIAAIPLGASWVGCQWVLWRLENSVKTAVGRNLLAGAEQIRGRLGDLPYPPEPGLAWSRFRLAVFRRAASMARLPEPAGLTGNRPTGHRAG